MGSIGGRLLLAGALALAATGCTPEAVSPSPPRDAGLTAALPQAAPPAPVAAAIPPEPFVNDGELFAKVSFWVDLMRPDTMAFFDDAADFVRRNPRWPTQQNMRRQVEKLMPETIAPQDALRWFAEFPPVSAVGKMRYADALLASGQADRGREVLRRLWTEEGLPDGLEATFLSRYSGYITPQDDVARLDRLLWDRNAQARRQAQRVGPDYALLADARLSLSSGTATAAKALGRVPASLQGDPGLLYERAQWHRKKEEYEAVTVLLLQPESAAGRPDSWWSVRNWAARRALGDGDAATAYRIASTHGMREGANFAEAEWLSGWIALRFLKDPGTALAHFNRFSGAVSTPVSEARGAYWSARALQATGDRASAAQRFRAAAEDGTTFYGQLAAAEVGIPLQIGGGGTPTAADRAAFASRELVRAVGYLNDMGEMRSADIFLGELARSVRSPVEGQLIAELAIARSRPSQAMTLARTMRTRGVSVPEHLFPVMAVRPVGSEDPALVLAIIRQESSFNPEAISSAGAAGLMQLMPGTAREVAGKLGLSYSQAALTSQPDLNMMLGQTYLSELLDRFDGSMLLSVAGYNAGPGNVRRWLDRNGDPRYDDLDVVDWIERIPVAETRNYVQRVFEGLHVYRYRLSPGTAQIALSPELKIQVASASR